MAEQVLRIKLHEVETDSLHQCTELKCFKSSEDLQIEFKNSLSVM